jgi:hypothetical protein
MVRYILGGGAKPSFGDKGVPKRNLKPGKERSLAQRRGGFQPPLSLAPAKALEERGRMPRLLYAALAAIPWVYDVRTRGTVPTIKSAKNTKKNVRGAQIRIRAPRCPLWL